LNLLVLKILAHKGEGMYLKSGVKLHNRFDIEVRDSKTGELATTVEPIHQIWD